MSSEETLDCFVATFEKLDDLTTEEWLDPVAWRLSFGDRDEAGFKHWRPVKVTTPPTFLDEIYARLPGRFPPLFETLVLSYRWAEVDLMSYRLLANPPGPGLHGLLFEMSKDPGLWEALIPVGYIPFGKGPDIDYDPICFDTGSRRHSGDCRVVKIDHEEILCNYRVKVVDELAPTFEHLVLQTIRLAERG